MENSVGDPQKVKIKPPCDQAIPFMGTFIYPKKMKTGS